jgi:hypothetical protein
VTMGIGTNAEKVPLNAYYRYGPPSFRPYSPECVEVEFCELRHNGVLRSSAWGRGASKRKKGYVVLLLPALPYEGIEFL